MTACWLPKLVLRVQRGHPRTGGAAYGFERPPLGWVGILSVIRNRVKSALANSPAASIGVAAFLDCWAREAESEVETELRGLNTEFSEWEDEVGCAVAPVPGTMVGVEERVVASPFQHIEYLVMRR